MHQQLFPSEITEYTTEYHFAVNSKPFRWIYLSLLLIIIAAIVLLPVIPVDVTSQSRGVVRTKNESTQIVPAVYGQVKESFLQEGLRVTKGDTLLLLVSGKIDAQIKNYTKTLKINLNFLDDLHSMLANTPEKLKTSKYKLEWVEYQAGIKEYQIKLELLREDFEQLKYLYKEKATAEIDYLKSKNNLETTKSQLDLFKQKTRNEWQAEITRIQLENENIKASIDQLKDERIQYVITAPVTGSLLQVAGVQPGSFVSPGEELAEISPDDELIAECYVSPSDIGYLTNGQKVRFQFDAFDYNQWGLLEGQVSKIPDDVITIDNQPVFKVRCSFPLTYLRLKTGQKGYLKKGMTFTGRFVLTRRTLFQLLFDKVDDWLNPKIL
jgi:multidrug resistance efflux pump